MSLSQALRYPLQRPRHLVALTLLQFIPLFGQFILTGYGMAVARSLHAGESTLPPLRWRQALVDGLRLFLVGLLYLAPILALVPTILTLGINHPGTTGGADYTVFLGILVPIALLFILLPLRKVLARPDDPQAPGWRRALVRILRVSLTLLVLLLNVFMLISLFTSLLTVRFSWSGMGQLNTIGYVLLIVMAVLLSIIGLAVHIGGLRYALEHKGLFAANSNAQMLVQHRARTGVFLLQLLLLSLLLLATMSIGLVFLLIPGLFALVYCTLAFWHLLAHYGMRMGIGHPAPTHPANMQKEQLIHEHLLIQHTKSL